MSSFLLITSASCYSFSLFLSCLALFFAFVRGAWEWVFLFLVVSFAISVCGLLLIQLMEDRFFSNPFKEVNLNGRS